MAGITIDRILTTSVEFTITTTSHSSQRYYHCYLTKGTSSTIAVDLGTGSHSPSSGDTIYKTASGLSSGTSYTIHFDYGTSSGSYSYSYTKQFETIGYHYRYGYIVFNANGGTNGQYSETNVHESTNTVVDTAQYATYTYKIPTGAACTKTTGGSQSGYTITFDGNGGTPSASSRTSARSYTTNYPFRYFGDTSSSPSSTYSVGTEYTWRAYSRSNIKSSITPTTIYAIYQTTGTTTYGDYEVVLPSATRSGSTGTAYRYQITFNANGGSVSYLTDYTSCTKTTTYSLKGWYTGTSPLADKVGNANDTVKTGNSSKTYYAQWDEDITYGNSTLDSLPTPTRSGHNFLGWYTAETGGSKVTTSTVFTASTMIYAHWEQNLETITITVTDSTAYSLTMRVTAETVKTYNRTVKIYRNARLPEYLLATGTIYAGDRSTNIIRNGLGPGEVFPLTGEMLYGSTVEGDSGLEYVFGYTRFDFEWTYPKVSGADFNVTAEEWKRFTTQLRTKVTRSTGTIPTFTEPSAGDDFTASIFNEVSDGLYQTEGSRVIPRVSVGQDIYASYFNTMRDSLNSEIY